MNNYLKDVTNRYTRSQYEAAKNRDEYYSVGSMNEDVGLISGLKIAAIILALSIGGSCLTKCMVNKEEKTSTRDNTSIEEYDDKYDGHAVNEKGNITELGKNSGYVKKLTLK